MIDDKESTQFVESWQGHIITVVCAVKLPAGERLNAKFSWMHIPSNRTVARRNHDDERSKSSLTITTYKDEDFDAQPTEPPDHGCTSSCCSTWNSEQKVG